MAELLEPQPRTVGPLSLASCTRAPLGTLLACWAAVLQKVDSLVRRYSRLFYDWPPEVDLGLEK
jgi:hypothetical protein